MSVEDSAPPGTQQGDFNGHHAGGKSLLRRISAAELRRQAEAGELPQMEASRALKEAELLVLDFREFPELPSHGDLVYLDPPYFPLSPTSHFTGFTAGSFSAKDQTDLALTFRDLDQAGALLMLSNSDTPSVRSLYKGFRVETIKARRAINSVASKRGEVSEILVLNY